MFDDYKFRLCKHRHTFKYARIKCETKHNKNQATHILLYREKCIRIYCYIVYCMLDHAQLPHAHQSNNINTRLMFIATLGTNNGKTEQKTTQNSNENQYV